MPTDIAKIAEDSTRGTFFLATGSIFSTIISAIAVFIIARLLGAELYGVYTVSLTVPSLLLLFVDFGVDRALIRFSANLHAKDANESLAKMLRYGILFKTLVGITIFSISLLLSDYLAMYIIARPDYGIYIRLGSLAIIFQIIFNTVGAVFIGLDHMEYSALATNIQALVKAVVSSLLVVLGFSVMGAITGFVVSYLIAGLFSGGLFFIKLYKPLNLSKHEDELTSPLKTMLSYGFPLYISTLLFGASSQLQNVILAIFTSDVDVGNFKAALNFVALLTALTGPVVMALLPAFSKLDKDDDQVKTFFTLTTKYMSLLMVPAITIIIIFSKELIDIIYGTSFLSAAFFLSLSAIPFFLVSLGRFTLGSLFNGLGETKATLKMTLINFIVFISLAPLLTKTHNVPGLIIALLFSGSASTILGAYMAKTKFDAQPDYKNMVKIYVVASISALPALLTIHFLPLQPLLKVLVGSSTYLFTYATIIPLVRIINGAELEGICQTINKIRLLKSLAKPLLTYTRKLTAKMER